MLLADKVSHILKDIADDAFHSLVSKDCSTIDDIIRERQRFEEANIRGVTQQFAWLSNTAAMSSCENLQLPLPSTDNFLCLVRQETEVASPSAPLAHSYEEALPTVH